MGGHVDVVGANAVVEQSALDGAVALCAAARGDDDAAQSGGQVRCGGLSAAANIIAKKACDAGWRVGGGAPAGLERLRVRRGG